MWRAALRGLFGAPGIPTLAEAMAEEPPTTPVTGACILWGPVGKEEAEVAGAAWPTSSIVLTRCVPDKVRLAALAEVPTEVLPRQGDTVESLVARLAASEFLEDSHVLKAGSGPKRVRLNATAYSQPRRRSWSVEVTDADPKAPGSHTLLNYTAFGRLAADWRARPMPRAVYFLGVCVWHAAYPFLTKVSQESAPTGCQLLLYYRLFGSCMGRHRDNYDNPQMHRVLRGEATPDELVEGSHHGGDANSQQTGSNVLIWTEGDADMTFALSFAPRDDLFAGRKEYRIHPIFCTRLGSGTLLVFSPVDDLFFCHEVYFEDPGGTATHRIAFAFRWLTQARRFATATEEMILSPELAEKEADRVRKKGKKRAADARAVLSRGF